jgi:hypothetical protein
VILAVSDNFYGRVDVVPGCCYLATEFVCVWFVPILPRRSMLFFEDSSGEGGVAAVPIRFSLKSAVVGYIRVFLLFFMMAGVAIPLNMMTDAKPGMLPALGLSAAVVFLVASSCLFMLWRISFASPQRRHRLSEVAGLPPRIVEILRSKSPDEVALEELAPRDGSDEV